MTCSACQRAIESGEEYDVSPLGPVAHYDCLPVFTLPPRLTMIHPPYAELPLFDTLAA